MENKEIINQYYQDSEINFGELFDEIKKNLISIILITSTFAIFSVFYSLSLPNIYYSQAILKISGDSASNSISSMASDFSGIASLGGINLPISGDESDYAIELIKSKEFVKHISSFDGIKENIMAIKKYDLNNKTIVYDKNIYDAKNKEWLRNPPAGRSKVPSYLELHEEISKLMNITKDRKTGFIKISFEHQSPEFASNFLDLVIREINQITRQIKIDESKSSLDYLYRELPKINEMDIRKSLNNLIESQLKTQMLANVRSDFILNTIDAPYIPEIKSKPSRSIICILGTLVGFILSMMFVLIRYFIYKD